MDTVKLIVQVDNMSCSSCVKTLSDGLSKMGGVKNVSVYLISKLVVLEYDPHAVAVDKIVNKIKLLGYEPSKYMEESLSNKEIYDVITSREKRTLFIKFLISSVLTIVLFMLSFFQKDGFSSFIISFFIWIYCGFHFHRGFYYSIKNKKFDMNSLVSISTTVGFIYNVFNYFYNYNSYHHAIHWHEIGMLVSFINFGKYLELFIKERSIQSVGSMLKMYPKFATIIDNNNIKKIDVKDIKEGDILLIKKGEQVAADSNIIEGETYVDESAFTGESNLIHKTKGDILYATTISMGDVVKARVCKTGKDTLFMQIFNLINNSQIKQTRISQKVDRVTNYFVPSVIIIATFASIFWFLRDGISTSVYIFSSVLVVACPCAMGLSVPIALFIGFTRASKSGFIINNPNILDDIRKINLVIFDKTGTLTYGLLNPSLIKIVDGDRQIYIPILKAILSYSSHILANNFVKYYKDVKSDCNVTDFKEFVGKGLMGKVDKNSVIVGNLSFLKENHIRIPKNIEDEVSNIFESHFLFAVNGILKGYIVFSDSLRENAKDIINEFKKKNIKVVIASGDKKSVVESIAKKLGIDEFYYEVLPQDKHSIVLKYKIMGYNVMMIGDGINDTAAISNADIGVALKRSSDIASVSSDIILIKEELSLIFKIMKLSYYINKIIKSNLLWAFGYNTVLIPIACGILRFFDGPFMPPYLSALAMSISSISVVLNSARLYRIRI